MTSFATAAGLLRDAAAARAFPAAAIEVGRRAGPLWREGFGRLTFDEDAAPATGETIFDLASLTKVVATATIAMQQVERGTIHLSGRIADLLDAWHGADREDVTVADLLEHAGGLTAYLPFFRDHSGRAEFEHAICTLALECPPRTRSIYSDLGFILLGFILEDRGGAPLAPLFSSLFPPDPARPLAFNPPRQWRPRTAPTELDTWRGRLLQGEVHDENAWALGGAAGHTGLFGTAGAVGAFARTMLDGLGGHDTALAASRTIARFVQRSTVPGSSRALGWDTMLPSSSCGTRMSAAAIGHTGFTGTSLWIDPVLDLYVVLLTNRVHPSRANNAIQIVRRAVHDAVVEALG